MTPGLSEPAPHAPAGAIATLRALLARPAAADALVWAVVPAPLAAPERLIQLADGTALAAHAAAFLPGEARPALLGDGRNALNDGGGLAAVGLTHALRADGAGRLVSLAGGVRGIARRFDRRGDGPSPRLLGGAAFAPLRAPGPWSAFGDATFWVARWTYVIEDGRAWLAACVDGAALADARAPLEEELGGWLRGLDAAPTPTPGRVPHGIATVEAAEVVERRVQRALDVIDRGEAGKLVVATHARVTGLAGVTDLDVLARLAAKVPGVRFLYRVGGASFLGGTPERLVAVRGRLVSADALAGSAAPGRADELLASDKDRREHAMVVEHLVRGLAGAGVTVAPPAAPRLRVLPTVAHLHTPIAGTLAAPAHVLELAAALHPTPAVAGTPPAVAAAWLAAEEPIARGWYAGPVGWCTPDGDGELVVALRSGLLVDDGALCQAGAGIVAGSSPPREREEMALKLGVMLEALGAR